MAKNSIRWRIMALIFAAVSCTNQLCFGSEIIDLTRQIDRVSGEIIINEIELDKLITNFHLKNKIATINKRRRQFLWSIINSGATEAGLIDATCLFFSHSRDKGMHTHVSGAANAGQLYPQIIGQEINAAGNVLEIAINAIGRLKISKQHLDPKNSLKKVRNVLDVIDSHFEQRQFLVNQLRNISDQEYALIYLEGKVLSDIRSALLSEYSRTYIRVRREFAWQNSMETLNLTRNVVGAIGNQISVEAGYAHNNYLNGLGNVLSEISAVGITTRPTFSLLVAKCSEFFARERLKHSLPMFNEDWRNNLSLDLQMLETSMKKYQPEQEAIFKRVAILKVESSLIGPTEELAQLERRNLAQRTSWQLWRNSLYGPTKMCNSLLGIIDGYDNRLSIIERNRLAASGNLTYTVGQAFNFCELWRERFIDERQNAQLTMQKKTTREVLHKRLLNLNNLLERAQ